MDKQEQWKNMEIPEQMYQNHSVNMHKRLKYALILKLK